MMGIIHMQNLFALERIPMPLLSTLGEGIIALLHVTSHNLGIVHAEPVVRVHPGHSSQIMTLNTTTCMQKGSYCPCAPLGSSRTACICPSLLTPTHLLQPIQPGRTLRLTPYMSGSPSLSGKSDDCDLAVSGYQSQTYNMASTSTFVAWRSLPVESRRHCV